MKNLRSLQLGVILSMIDITLDTIAEAEYDYNYDKNKEVLEVAYKAIENKRKRISALKSIYFLINNTKEYVVITYIPKKEIV